MRKQTCKQIGLRSVSVNVDRDNRRGNEVTANICELLEKDREKDRNDFQESQLVVFIF